MNVAYNNFSDMDSKPLTGCVQNGIFALVLKEIIFILSIQHTVLYGKLYLCFSKDNGKINCVFVYTVTSIV